MEELKNYMKKRISEKISEIIDKCITQRAVLYPKVMTYSYDNFGYDKEDLIKNRTRIVDIPHDINADLKTFDKILDKLFDADDCIGNEIEDEDGLCSYSEEAQKRNTLEIVNLPEFFDVSCMFKEPYREETENLIITFPYLISELIRQTIYQIFKE